MYDNLFFILGKTKRYRYLYVPCRQAQSSKVPKVALLYIHTPSKFYQITKKVTKVIQKDRKRENFCLFDLTFFVQNVIFQRFRICGFRQQQVIDPSSESLHRKKNHIFASSTNTIFIFNWKKISFQCLGQSLSNNYWKKLAEFNDVDAFFLNRR